VDQDILVICKHGHQLACWHLSARDLSLRHTVVSVRSQTPRTANPPAPHERKQRSMFCWTQMSVLCAQIRYQCLTVQSSCSLIIVRLSWINWILIASVAGFVPQICSQPTVRQCLCLTGCAFADKLFAYCVYESDFTAPPTPGAWWIITWLGWTLTGQRHTWLQTLSGIGSSCEAAWHDIL